MATVAGILAAENKVSLETSKPMNGFMLKLVCF